MRLHNDSFVTGTFFGGGTNGVLPLREGRVLYRHLSTSNIQGRLFSCLKCIYVALCLVLREEEKTNTSGGC